MVNVEFAFIQQGAVIPITPFPMPLITPAERQSPVFGTIGPLGIPPDTKAYFIVTNGFEWLTYHNVAMYGTGSGFC